MKEWIDRNFTPGWQNSWGDYSTAFLAMLSSIVSFLATNSAELVAIIGFVPEGPAQGLLALGIFASLMSAGMLSKWIKQEETADGEPTED